MKCKRKLTSFGIKVKKRLIELNMTQKELANDLGVSESYLADVLRGEKQGLKYLDEIGSILKLETKIENLKEVV
ncbi:helix-turn-helix domain-containing protein [Maledivibacter halophilus]|uniref:Helix-turn-helix n=1 Tax=Maledivibacter halophilus TaxID=36842 RepID=A0A1T5LW95_9FIRM|nr:helix-turn-helix transcriptional regulator [Maledivibacter halophilus]SKC68575.1 Helix-turn-helix [Maledivibacter halophilus]SKC71577.1 Helix-turn-helix [Maledivibacter halophilus]SKC80266.1 Helix-turn-helix [Maledivibacter halophilus]